MGLLNTLVQSIILSIVSNVLAQVIANYQANSTNLFKFDTTPIAHFVIYTIINVPINVLWQNWLEATFPGSKPAPVPAAAAEKTKQQKQANGKPAVTEKEKLDVKNTIIKFVLDQTVGAAINVPLFLGTIGYLQGQNLAQILTAIQTETIPLCLAGIKLWPAVSIISFAAIPVERRVIFGSLAGVAWNIYLSLRAAQ